METIEKDSNRSRHCRENLILELQFSFESQSNEQIFNIITEKKNIKIHIFINRMSTTLDMKALFISEKPNPGEPDERNNKETLIKETLQIVKKTNSSRNRQLRFITLATIVVWLLKPWIKVKKQYLDVSTDVAHWRSLAITRGEQLDRFLAVINLQKNRIACLERDLQTLVNLAQDTQKMLAEISPNGNALAEKRSS